MTVAVESAAGHGTAHGPESTVKGLQVSHSGIAFPALWTALVLFVIGSLFFGRFDLTFQSWWKVLTQPALSDVAGVVLWQIRLPRVLAAALIGGALSVSGAAFQGLFCNPMASPDILGAYAGAGFGASIGILCGFNIVGIQLLGFAGGLAAVLLAWTLAGSASRFGGDPTLTLILVGIIIREAGMALIRLTEYVADPHGKLAAITFWLIGGLSAVTPHDLQFAAVPIIAGVVPMLLLRWRLNMLSFGDEEARALGVNPWRIRIVVIVCSAKPVIFDISLEFATGEVLCLLGANGSGKTTLFKTLLRLQRPIAGRVCIDGEDISRWPSQRLAKTLGYVPQAHTHPFAFRVRDVVLMARSAHIGVFGTPGKRDLAIAKESMERLSILSLANEHYTELSGGERQLVLIARALAQQAPVLVLDEPTSNLDFGNQMRVLRHVKELAQSGLGVMMTTHFPDFAFLCASRVALMKQGRILALDSPEATLTQASLEEAYGTRLRIADAGHGIRVVVPILH